MSTQDNAPEIVQVPLINPRVTELQARFSKALANPPEGIDTDVVKPYFDGDEELWAIDSDQVGVRYWSPSKGEWFERDHTYSDYAFGTCTLLRWTVGVIPAPEDMISGRAYFQNHSEDGKPVGKALTLDSRDHPVEECDRRYEQMKAERDAAHAEIAALGEQLLLAQSQRDDAESKLAEVHVFEVAGQQYRVAHSSLLEGLRQKMAENVDLKTSQTQQSARIEELQEEIAAERKRATLLRSILNGIETTASTWRQV